MSWSLFRRLARSLHNWRRRARKRGLSQIFGRDRNPPNHDSRTIENQAGGLPTKPPHMGSEHDANTNSSRPCQLSRMLISTNSQGDLNNLSSGWTCILHFTPMLAKHNHCAACWLEASKSNLRVALIQSSYFPGTTAQEVELVETKTVRLMHENQQQNLS